MARNPISRHQQIMDLLSKAPICSPLQLAETTGVSSETIRKDLNALARKGLIIKLHGGVALTSATPLEIPFDLRATHYATEKKQIANTAAQLIEQGDTIILESCTTNLELAKKLCEKADLLSTLSVITNSLSITSLFDSGRKCHRLFLLGGWINPEQYAAHGRQTTELLKKFHVNKSFISGVALSNEYILTGYYDDDVSFQKAAIKAADKTILMLDHSKFDKAAIMTVAHLSEMDYLVTDRVVNEQERQALQEMDVCYIAAQE